MYMDIAFTMTLLMQLKNWPNKREFITHRKVFFKESKNKWNLMMEITKLLTINTMELLVLISMEFMTTSICMTNNSMPNSQDKNGMDLVQRESITVLILKVQCILIVICLDWWNLSKEKSLLFYTMETGMLLCPM